MPTINSSAELNDDLAEIDNEAYERMTDKIELYSILNQGMRDVGNGDEVSFDDGLKMLRGKHNR